MAIKKPLAAKPPVETEERTWRANIETPRSGGYSIQVYRQYSALNEDGELVGEPATSVVPINRMAKDIASEVVTLPNGTVVPAALVLSALPLFFDKWALEDADAKVAADAAVKAAKE